MFRKIDEDEALIVERGVYKSAEVYAGPNGGLFIKAKGGFVKIKADGSTSHSSIKITTLMREGPLFKDPYNRLYVEQGSEGERRKPVALDYSPTDEVLRIADIRASD